MRKYAEWRLMSQVPNSPCKLTCKLRPEDNVCSGCGRTIDEIVEWGGANAERQNQIAGQASDRLIKLSPN